MILLLLLCSLAAAAPASFKVGFLDDPRGTIECAGDGSVCAADVAFPETTRFWIDVPYSYSVNIEVAPFKPGLVCRTLNDVYLTRSTMAPFANNSLAAFKAVPGVYSAYGKEERDGIIYASLAVCGSLKETVRLYVGVYQADNGFLGSCSTGHFRLRLSDSSHKCGYRRDDKRCYEGDLACYYATANATVRRDFPTGDPVRCCPAAQPGQADSVLTAPSCTCAGLDHVASAPTAPAVPTPAGTCQTGAFCRDKCGVTGGISASGVSYGSCCADCSAADVSIVNGRCVNSCPAFGVGSAPARVPQPTAAPFKTTTTTTLSECVDCDCARAECEARCMADGGGSSRNFVCSSVNGVLSRICKCQPADRISEAATVRGSLSALVTLMMASWLVGTATNSVSPVAAVALGALVSTCNAADWARDGHEMLVNRYWANTAASRDCHGVPYDTTEIDITDKTCLTLGSPTGYFFERVPNNSTHFRRCVTDNLSCVVNGNTVCTAFSVALGQCFLGRTTLFEGQVSREVTLYTKTTIETYTPLRSSKRKIAVQELYDSEDCSGSAKTAKELWPDTLNNGTVDCVADASGKSYRAFHNSYNDRSVRMCDYAPAPSNLSQSCATAPPYICHIYSNGGCADYPFGGASKVYLRDAPEPSSLCTAAEVTVANEMTAMCTSTFMRCTGAMGIDDATMCACYQAGLACFAAVKVCVVTPPIAPPATPQQIGACVVQTGCTAAQCRTLGADPQSMPPPSSSAVACTDCDCVQSRCADRCATNGVRASNNVCSSVNGVIVDQACQCDGDAGTGDAASLGALAVWHALLALVLSC